MKIKALSFSFLFFFTAVQAQQNLYHLLVGTYTNKCENKGVFNYKLEVNSGNSLLHGSTVNIQNPSFLALSSDNKHLYAVNESGNSSTVTSFNYDGKAGKIIMLNKQATKGADPCYLITDDKNVITANYSGGSITVFFKNVDGSLTDAKQVVQLSGSGPNKERQEASHLHMVAFSEDHKYVLAVDLGADKIYVYNYNADASKDILTFKGSVSMKPGAGPRHLTFSEDGKFVYVLNELDGGLLTYSFLKGELILLDDTSVMPRDYTGDFRAAAILLSPDGKFLYATNRGEANTISIFKVLKNGKLEFKETVSTLGKGPRSFVIDPTGNLLLVANQFSNEVVIFKRDKETGSLTDSEKRISVCEPVHLLFEKRL
ncbi:6-phosphogluconolactonase [Flavobacterium sp. LM5]|jgi:6-phosphogluconolactonase|uniref:lactonase family protein n=1 Tax=Flavobacterium sp. LM5 TaxID=1938610 RepID=UPI000993DEC8|nr:lactonase family protein [Flavobacterium sp. LM5]OOV29625.1 6-phosphogluconolactonase [Flavobacterium sp. LM5]